MLEDELDQKIVWLQVETLLPPSFVSKTPRTPTAFGQIGAISTI